MEEEDSYYDQLPKEELIRVIKVLESDLFKIRTENMRLTTKLKDTEDRAMIIKKVRHHYCYNRVEH